MIHLRNWKGITQDIKLGRLTMLTGPNGSGKSAIAVAPMFAITGTVPEGKTLDDAARYMSGTSASVGIELSDGRQFTRSITVEPKTGKVSQSVHIVGEEKLSNDGAKEWLARECADFAPMFNLDEFRKQSKTKKRDTITSLQGVESHATSKRGDTLRNRIAVAFLVESLGEGTVGTQARAKFGSDTNKLTAAKAGELAASMLSELKPEERREFDAMLPQITAQIAGPITQALADAIRTATDEANASKAARDQARAAVRKLSEEQASLDVPAKTAAELKEARGKLAQQVQELTERIGRIEGREQARLALTRRREMLEGDKQTLGERIAELPIPDGGSIEQIKARRDAAVEELGKAQERHENLEQQYHKSVSLIADLTRQGNLLRSQIDAARANEWNTLRQLSDQAMGEPTTIGRTRELIEEMRDIIMPHAMSAVSVEDLESKLADLDVSLGQAVKMRDELHAEKDAAELLMQSALASRQEAGKAWQQVEDQRGELERTRREFNRLDAEILAVDVELQDLEGDDAGQLGQLREDRRAMLVQIGECDAGMERHVEADQARKLLLRATENAERETVKHEVAKRLTVACRAVREQMMAGLVRPLTDRIDAVLSAVRPDLRSYCRLENARGTAVFDLGWRVGGAAEYPWETLSGGESVIFGAALAYALVTLAEPPLPFLAIESAEADEETLRSILCGLTNVRADLGNILLCSHRDRVTPFDGGEEWTCIDVRGFRRGASDENP